MHMACYSELTGSTMKLSSAIAMLSNGKRLVVSICFALHEGFVWWCKGKAQIPLITVDQPIVLLSVSGKVIAHALLKSIHTLLSSVV